MNACQNYGFLCAKEKLYTKCNGARSIKIAKRREYITARNLFDKEHKLSSYHITTKQKVFRR